MRLLLSRHISRPRIYTFSLTMAQKRSASEKKPAGAAVPRPSSSVILVSPTNQILLLHRVQSSSSFPSAYVFAGGNLSAQQDGEIPSEDSPLRHVDSEVYRRAAIRETFEESGILLVKRDVADKHLIQVRDSKRERIRKAVHSNEKNFFDWVREMGAEPDTGALLPFTRWVTPTNVPKRFTTQMYIYFLPLDEDVSDLSANRSNVPTPTSDGGLEHTAAEFDYASSWLSLANSKAYPSATNQSQKDIIMFPPQLFLLHLLAPFLPAPNGSPYSKEDLANQRDSVREFLKTSTPPWGEKCISPTGMGMSKDGRSILGLNNPGPAELVKEGRKGEYERIVLARFSKAGPVDVEVKWRKDLADIIKENPSSGSKL